MLVMTGNTGEPCWDKNQMYQLHVEDNLNASEIGDELDETRNKVIFWLKKHDLYQGIECPGCEEVFRHIRAHFGYNPDCVPDDPDKNPLYIAKVCDYCNVGFYRDKRNVLYSQREFCSDECRLDWLADDEYEHPTESGANSWIAISERIRERDNYKCQICGMGQSDHYEKYGLNLHVHHIKPVSEFDSLSEAHMPGNLITLCCTDHLKYEGDESLSELTS